MVREVVLLAPLLNFIAHAAMVLLPVIAVRVWLVNPVQFGALEAAFPLGFAAGAGLLLAAGSRLRRRGRWMIAGIVAGGGTMTAAMVMPGVGAALPVVVAMGLSLGVANVLIQVALQSEVSRPYRVG